MHMTHCVSAPTSATRCKQLGHTWSLHREQHSDSEGQTCASSVPTSWTRRKGSSDQTLASTLLRERTRESNAGGSKGSEHCERRTHRTWRVRRRREGVGPPSFHNSLRIDSTSVWWREGVCASRQDRRAYTEGDWLVFQLCSTTSRTQFFPDHEKQDWRSSTTNRDGGMLIWMTQSVMRRSTRGMTRGCEEMGRRRMT